MTWVTWRQYRYQGVLAAVLLAALAVVLLITGLQVPAGGQQCMTITGLHNAPSCLAAHRYRGYLTYQPASRFWAFQGIETGIFVVLAAVLLGITFWVLKRRDA